MVGISLGSVEHWRAAIVLILSGLSLGLFLLGRLSVSRDEVRLCDWDTVDVLGLLMLLLSHLVALASLLLILLHGGILRRRSDDELGCVGIIGTVALLALIELLSELMLLALLDHEADLLVARLDLIELDLEPASFFFKLLLFSADLPDISGTRIDSRLHSEALLSERLLAALAAVEVLRRVRAIGPDALALDQLDVGADFAHADFELLFLSF